MVRASEVVGVGMAKTRESVGMVKGSGGVGMVRE